MKQWRLAMALIFSLVALADADAASGRIKKVLPHYLDLEGRHMLAPSLYERDAYQAHLRRNPAERSALRFDVNWKAAARRDAKLKLRLELRGSQGGTGTPLVLETPVKPPALFTKWSSLTLSGEEYRNLGDVIAWRATLWDDAQLVAEQKSFLW